MNNQPRSVQKTDPSSAGKDSILAKAIRLAESGKCDQAIAVLGKANGASPEIVNARAVCLMRLGRASDAVRILRPVVIPAGVTWMKPELPVIYRTNFSTALLLAGLTMGVRDTLIEIAEKDHPSVVRLQNALKQWEQHLSLWQWCCWKLGIAQDVPIPIAFVPGEFVDPLSVSATAPPPARPVSDSDGRKAV